MKIAYYILFFIILSSLCYAANPHTPPQTNLNGLQIITPKNDYFIQNTTFSLHYHVFNGTYASLNVSSYTCNYHLYNKSNDHIITGLLIADSNGVDKYFIINNTITKNAGIYPYIVWCNTSTEYGYVSDFIEITENGLAPEAPSSIFAILALLPMILALIFIIGAATLNEEHTALKIFSYLFSLVLYYASMYYTIVIIKHYYSFMELTEGITIFLYVFTIVLTVVITYFIIYLIIKAIHAAADDKKEKLVY